MRSANSALLLAGLAAALVAAAPARTPRAPQEPGREELRVDGARLNSWLEEVRRFGGTPDGGTTRLAYSSANLEARAWVRGLMEEAGLETTVDLAGNLIGRRAGSEPGLAPLTLGSHIDTVPGGGSYDGQVGSMAAVEVARSLHDAALTLRHPLELVIFQNEEGGKTGSRAWSGEVEPAELDIVTASGRTIHEGIALLGGDPDRLGEARRGPGDVAAYLELHVEQGGVLETAGVDVGVVEGIVGIQRWNVTVDGFANHAGTTPMDQRRDALVAAARFVESVHETARTTPGRQVATVGRIEAQPGAPNVIPGRVVLSLEIRDLDMEGIERLFARLEAEARRIGETGATSFTFERFYTSRAAPTEERIRRLIENAAARLGLSSLRMPSGAGHDAQSVAAFAPIGMIFVPSAGGISHSPREHTEAAAITSGANVLLHTLLALDAADVGR